MASNYPMRGERFYKNEDYSIENEDYSIENDGSSIEKLVKNWYWRNILLGGKASIWEGGLVRKYHEFVLKTRNLY